MIQTFCIPLHKNVAKTYYNYKYTNGSQIQSEPVFNYANWVHVNKRKGRADIYGMCKTKWALVYIREAEFNSMKFKNVFFPTTFVPLSRKLYIVYISINSKHKYTEQVVYLFYDLLLTIIPYILRFKSWILKKNMSIQVI